MALTTAVPGSVQETAQPGEYAMTPRFYIATRLERAADHNNIRDRLHVLGHRITYDWTAHGSVRGEGSERIREVALAEKRGVQDADYVVVLLPGGRGTHAELGMALAWGKPVFVHARAEEGFFAQDERTCAFYHDPLVTPFLGPLPGLIVPILAWAQGYTVGDNTAALGSPC